MIKSVSFNLDGDNYTKREGFPLSEYEVVYEGDEFVSFVKSEFAIDQRMTYEQNLEAFKNVVKSDLLRKEAMKSVSFWAPKNPNFDESAPMVF